MRRPGVVAIGVRKAPEPNGQSWFVRIDTVHPGDKDGRKGVRVVKAYHPAGAEHQTVAPSGELHGAFLPPDLPPRARRRAVSPRRPAPRMPSKSL